MSDIAAAEAAATTDWRTYDGPVAQQFMFYVVFFPLVMGICILLPMAACVCCLSKGRPAPYMRANAPGGLGTPNTTRSGGCFPSSSPMWPSVSFSFPSSPATVAPTHGNKRPDSGMPPAAADEATLVAPSPDGLEKRSASQQMSPRLSSAVFGSFGSPVSLGSHASHRSYEGAGFDESPILKSFSPFCPSGFWTRC